MATATALSLIQCVKAVTIAFVQPILGTATDNYYFRRKARDSLVEEIEKSRQRLLRVKDEEAKKRLEDYIAYLEERLAKLPEVPPEKDKNTNDNGMTTLYRTKDPDYPDEPWQVICIKAHQLMGFLKEYLNSYKSVFKIKMQKGRMPQFFRIYPDDIVLRDKAWKTIDVSDGFIARPIRFEIRGKEQTSIKESEIINASYEDPLYARFIITLYNGEIKWEHIEAVLKECGLFGIGQWRTSSEYGGFVLVDVTDITEQAKEKILKGCIDFSEELKQKPVSLLEVE